MTILELEDFFNDREIPKSMKLNDCEFATDLPKLISSNISYLKSNPGNKGYMPYYRQLIEIRNKLISHES